MEITFQLTADDYRHGKIAWRNSSAFRRWGYRLYVSVMAVGLAFMSLILVFQQDPELRRTIWLVLGGGAFVLLVVFLSPWLTSRWEFRRMPSAQIPVTVAVTDSGLRTQSQFGDSQVAWSAYMGWGEEKSVFIILPHPRIYVPIPKRAFTAEQVNEFREILKKNIVAK